VNYNQLMVTGIIVLTVVWLKLKATSRRRKFSPYAIFTNFTCVFVFSLRRIIFCFATHFPTFNVKLELNQAIIDARLCPQATTHDVYLLFFITEQNLIGIVAGILCRYMLAPLRNTHDSS